MAIYKNKIGKIIVEKVENIFIDPKYEEYRKFYKKKGSRLFCRRFLL